MKKLISAAFATVMALSMSWMVASAEVSAAKSASTALTATANSTYTITVPESVAMTGSSSGAGTYTGTVPVNLKGDIEENAKIVVTATATTMTCGTSSAAVSFTAKPKTEWTRTDLLNNGTTSNYKVQATLMPGQWKGTATFSCEKLYTAYIQILASDIGSAPTYSRTVTVTYREGWTWSDFIISDYNSEGYLEPSLSSEDSPIICNFAAQDTSLSEIRLCGVRPNGTRNDIPQNQRIDSNEYVRITGWGLDDQ